MMLTESELKWLQERNQQVKKCCATCHIKQYQNVPEFDIYDDEEAQTGYEAYCSRCTLYEGDRHSSRQKEYWDDERKYEKRGEWYTIKKSYREKRRQLVPDWKDCAEFEARVAMALTYPFVSPHNQTFCHPKNCRFFMADDRFPWICCRGDDACSLMFARFQVEEDMSNEQ